MPLPGNAAQMIVVYHSNDVRQMQMILHFMPDAGSPPTINQAEADSFAQVFSTNMHNVIKGCLAADASFDGVRCTVSGSGLSFSAQDTSQAGVGTEAGDTVPDINAVCIQKKTLSPGRTGRGRMFFGCVPESFTTDNRLTVAAITQYNLFATNLIMPMTTSSGVWNLALYSRHDANLIAVDAMVIDKILKRQSRRQLQAVL